MSRHFWARAYFRAVGGDTRQYGLSTRALAVDTALPRPEEFPRFTSFWFERPGQGLGTLTLYALMDSPSVAGAIRFQIAPGGTQVMDIDSALYPRKAIERFGIAPLTSMFFYGENDRRGAKTGGRKSTTPTACRCGPAPANDPQPRATGSGGQLQTEADWTCIPEYRQTAGLNWFRGHIALWNHHR